MSQPTGGCSALSTDETNLLYEECDRLQRSHRTIHAELIQIQLLQCFSSQILKIAFFNSIVGIPAGIVVDLVFVL